MTDWKGWCVFLTGLLIHKDIALVKRLARERVGTPEGEMLERELSFHRRENAVGFAQAMEESDEMEEAA